MDWMWVVRDERSQGWLHEFYNVAQVVEHLPSKAQGLELKPKY
jgi:hypothetical protein